MPSIFSHPAVPLALTIGLGANIIPPRLLLAGIAGCILPDADVITFHLDVSYGSVLAHRGFTHSILFALMCGALAAACATRLRTSRRTASLFVGIATASHGVLDAMTTGGSGIAFFWPLTDERYFLPVQMILVSPISPSRFFSERGLAVLASELMWVWLPACLFAVTIWLARRALARNAAGRKHE